MKIKLKKPIVYYPVDIEREKYFGEIYGYFYSSTNSYNIIDINKKNKKNIKKIGVIFAEKPQNNFEKKLVGYWENDTLIFKKGNYICKKRPYNLILDVFSRNAGILESSLMLNKSVIISGLGSVGSLCALELARAGVGNFLLIDNDILDYNNICRHQAGIKYVGNYKVSVIQDLILQINPRANITTNTNILENVEKKVFDEFINSETIIIGCADNRASDLYANHVSKFYKIPFISIGFWERASAGEIFYSIPEKTPCYECVFGELNNVVSNRLNVNRRFYTNEEELASTIFEPGISIDINFITIIGIKLAIDLLNLNTNGYIFRLLNYLSQFTLICNTNNVKIGGDQLEIFSHPLQITTSIKVDFSDSCRACKL